MKLLGIHRSPRFSPGRHKENDRLIFEATVGALQQSGCTVETMAEDDVGTTFPSVRMVFSMCQGSLANTKLQAMERSGTLIINSPQAVQNCHRARLHHCLGDDRRGFAPSDLVPTHGKVNVPVSVRTEGGCWIKRGDVHATGPEDVVRVQTEEAYLTTLRAFRKRDIPIAVVSPHIEGEVVKFYGVLGSPFFRFYREQDPDHVPAAFAAARPEVERLVRRVGLEIYGGDAIMTPDGRAVLIDINDWPSFARFRDEASRVIGDHILRRAAALEARVELPPRRDAVA
jgi:hypothetical protein